MAGQLLVAEHGGDGQHQAGGAHQAAPQAQVHHQTRGHAANDAAVLEEVCHEARVRGIDVRHVVDIVRQPEEECVDDKLGAEETQGELDDTGDHESLQEADRLSVLTLVCVILVLVSDVVNANITGMGNKKEEGYKANDCKNESKIHEGAPPAIVKEVSGQLSANDVAHEGVGLPHPHDEAAVGLAHPASKGGQHSWPAGGAHGALKVKKVVCTLSRASTHLEGHDDIVIPNVPHSPVVSRSKQEDRDGVYDNRAGQEVPELHVVTNIATVE